MMVSIAEKRLEEQSSRIAHAMRYVREFFLLSASEQRVAALEPSVRGAVRSYRNAAVKRHRGAQEVRLRWGASEALPLYREAHALFLAACLAREGVLPGSWLDADSLSKRFSTTLAASRTAVPDGFARIERARAPGATREAVRLADDYESAAAWLSAFIGPLSPNQPRAKRFVRVALATSLLLGLGVFGTVRALLPTNLALHRPAFSSSRAYDTAPEGAVDGRLYGRLGFHSQREESPWLSIDLGQRYEIARVKIYGRDDCCYEQSLPLALEASDDGTTYRTFDERSDPFTAFDPWISTPRSVVARYVRLKTRAYSVLVVSEVEVYGHAAHGSR
jgi:hypothetical protein